MVCPLNPEIFVKAERKSSLKAKMNDFEDVLLMNKTDHQDTPSLQLVKFYRHNLADVCSIQKLVFPTEYQESLTDLHLVFDRRDLFGYCFQSVDTNDIVGYCIGFPIDPFDILPAMHDPLSGSPISMRPKDQCPIFIYDCCVNPQFQGNSLGSQLVQEFINETARNGFSRIWAVAVDANARSFWERQGFVTASERLDGTANNNFWDKIESEKTLPGIYGATGKLQSYSLDSILMVFKY
jgi:ribosomal protein S18 acetylase RimI-like enzyme